MSNALAQRLPTYAPLSEHEVRLLAEATRTNHRFLAHLDLIHKGQKPGPAIVILDGWAMRYKIMSGEARQIVAFVIPGTSAIHT